MDTNIRIKTKEITSEMVKEYMYTNDVIKALEKKKEELRASILHAFPNGGYVGNYKIDIKIENGRRSFKFDDAKAVVDDDTWNRVFKPFIKLGDPIMKLLISRS